MQSQFGFDFGTTEKGDNILDKSAEVHNLKTQSMLYNNQTKKLDRKETAQYIADMVLELRNLAKAVDIKSLQDLLELCFYDAFATANRVEISESELQRLQELSRASGAP